MYVLTDGWTDGQTDGRTDGRTDGLADESIWGGVGYVTYGSSRSINIFLDESLQTEESNTKLAKQFH